MGRDWPTEFRMWYVVWHGVMNFWSNICNISHIHSKRHIKTMTMTNMYVAFFFLLTNLRSATIEKVRIYSINDNQFSHFVLVKNTAVCCIFGFSQGINVSISVKISWISRLELFLVIKTAQKSLLKTSSLMLDFLRNYWNQEVDFFFFHIEMYWTK